MNWAILRKMRLAKRSTAWHRGLVAFMFLALVIQGYATQTHFHKEGTSTASIVLKAGGSPTHDNLPANDDPARCPICQQITHAGQYVAPAWLLPFLVLAAFSTIEITTAVLPHYDTVSHSWRGRGPPLH
jgi:hypothetical protein